MSKPKAQLELTDPDLFGNDAAEDEDETVFSSYVLEREEASEFVDARHRIRIVRAYKGEGKSALLRLARSKLNSDELVVNTTGPSISPDVDSNDTDQLVRAWKERIFRTLASEIGSRIGMAWSDDAMTLVDEAESNGFKGQSFVSSIINRIQSKIVPLEIKNKGSNNPEKLVQRWSKGKPKIWLIVDDVDQNFSGDSKSKARAASFFIACRQLSGLVPELRLRLAVRPNVWTTIKRDYEALSHVEQYVVDLNWPQAEIRKLLAQRVEAYLRRNNQAAILDDLRDDAWPREETLIAFAFDAPMTWGGRDRPPHVVLATLSRYRPRWVIELSKVSAKNSAQHGRKVIALNDIESELPAFGRRRIDDTIAEFRSQCPEVEDLIAAFAQQSEGYETNELFESINKRVLTSVHPRIVGVTGKAQARDVAAFLFQIGFLSARRNFPDGNYEHLSYSDNPSLLQARTNIDQGVSWEIHPVFRQALGLKNRGRRAGTRRKRR